jgi:hypothetical protein
MVLSSLRSRALWNGYGLSLTLSYEIIAGWILTAGSKNKRELITSSCSTSAAARTHRHRTQYDENNILNSVGKREDFSVITETG